MSAGSAQGRVEVSADLVICRPAEGGNGTLLLERSNRGRTLMPMLFDNALKALAQRLEARTRAVADCIAPMPAIGVPLATS